MGHEAISVLVVVPRSVIASDGRPAIPCLVTLLPANSPRWMFKGSPSVSVTRVSDPRNLVSLFMPFRESLVREIRPSNRRYKIWKVSLRYLCRLTAPYPTLRRTTPGYFSPPMGVFTVPPLVGRFTTLSVR